jgi:hypothetical protein
MKLNDGGKEKNKTLFAQMQRMEKIEKSKIFSFLLKKSCTHHGYKK